MIRQTILIRLQQKEQSAKQKHKKPLRGFEPRAFSLQGRCTNRCAIMAMLTVPYFMLYNHKKSILFLFAQIDLIHYVNKQHETNTPTLFLFWIDKSHHITSFNNIHHTFSSTKYIRAHDFFSQAFMFLFADPSEWNVIDKHKQTHCCYNNYKRNE